VLLLLALMSAAAALPVDDDETVVAENPRDASRLRRRGGGFDAGDQRDQMTDDVIAGGANGGDVPADAAKGKYILVRGCDPVMAKRAAEFLPPLLGNPTLIGSTNDDDFVAKLQERKWDIVMFAPGACRYNAARQAIPGGNAKTKGWTLVEYRALVREHQGDAVPIVETGDEQQIVPLLRAALRV
jgi:hypothetical protein